MAQDEYTSGAPDEPMASVRFTPAALTRLGEALREQRRLSNLSQQQLEMASGVPQKVISRIERGEISDPSFGDLALLAHSLNVRPGFFAAALGLPVSAPQPPQAPVDVDPRGAWIQQRSRAWTQEEVDLYLDLALAIAQRIEQRHGRGGHVEDSL